MKSYERLSNSVILITLMFDSSISETVQDRDVVTADY